MNSFLRRVFSWWVGRKLLIATVVTVVILSAMALTFGQVATRTLVFPLMVNGPGPGAIKKAGDIRYSTTFFVANNSTTDAQFTLEFFTQSGQPYVVGVSSSTLETAEVSSKYILNIPANRTQAIPLTEGDTIDVFRGQVTAPLFVSAAAEYYLFAAELVNGQLVERFRSFARFAGADSFAGQRFFVTPVLLGANNVFGQRDLVLSIANPGSTAASALVTLLASDNSVAGTLNLTVPAMGQQFRLLSLVDFPGVVLNGRLRGSASQDVYVGAIQFRNEFFTAVRVEKDNFPPIVGIDSPSEGQAFTVNSVSLNGWAGDQDSILANAEVLVDGGAAVSVPLTIDRPDVPRVFPGVQLKSGYTYTISALANGAHSVRVRATDNMGVSVEMVRNFVVNVPKLVFQSGTYKGDYDPVASLPADGRIIKASMVANVTSNGDGNGILNGLGYDLRIGCPSNGNTSGVSGPVSLGKDSINDGKFSTSLANGAETSTGKFTSSTTMDVQINLTADSLMYIFKPPCSAISAVSLVAHLNRQ